jgi:4-oxalocrotonate tautomerase
VARVSPVLALPPSLFSPSFCLLSWTQMIKVVVKKGGFTMPFIKMEAGKMNKETKEKLISGLTKVASETLGIPEDAFTVLLKENETDNWGVGGKVLTRIFEERAKKR